MGGGGGPFLAWDPKANGRFYVENLARPEGFGFRA
jgi:hypothetical protein